MPEDDIPENRSIVLVQKDAELVETQLDGGVSSDTMRLAIKRVRQNKEQRQQKDQNRQGEIERAGALAEEANRKQQEAYASQMMQSGIRVKEFCKEPKTFAQHAVAYISEHREEVIQRVLRELGGAGVGKFSSLQGAVFVMSKVIYPEIADQVVFKDADKWNPALVASDSSSYGLFVRNVLGVFVKDLALLFLKNRGGQWGWVDEADLYQLLRQSDQEVDLGKVIGQLSEEMVSQKYTSCNGDENTYNFGTRMSAIFNGLKIGRYPELVVDNAGYYIFEAVKRSDLSDKEMTMDKESVGALMDEIIRSLSGVKFPEEPVPVQPQVIENEEDDNSALCLPTLEKLDAVKTQLRILMIRIGISSRYHKVLPGEDTKGNAVDQPIERKFFDEFAVAVFGKKEGGSEVFDALKEYRQTSSFGLWSETKGSLRRKYNAEPVAHEIMELFRMAEYLYKLQYVGKIYIESGQPRQQYYGEILMELGKIYTERLLEMAVNLEVKLKVGDFRTDEIGRTVSGLAGLLDSSQLSNAIEAAVSVESGLQAGEEANSVLTHQGQLASFDKRLGEEKK